MADAVKVSFDFSNVESVFGVVESAAQTAIRPAAQAAAQIFYDEMRLRVPKSDKGHWFHGTSFKKTGQKYWIEPGTLRDSIYQKYSEDNSGPNRATYHIAWNHKKAPYGFMVERGTSRAAAKPFLRPTYDARYNDAFKAAQAKLVEEMRNAMGGIK